MLGWPRRKTVAIDKRNKGTLETCCRILPVDRVSSLVRSLVRAKCHFSSRKKRGGGSSQEEWIRAIRSGPGAVTEL